MNKLFGLLGIAQRARKLTYGEQVLTDIKSNNSKLVLISKLASDNTIKKISDKCNFYHINYYLIDEEVLNQSTGKGNVKYLSVNDEGFSKKINQIMKG